MRLTSVTPHRGIVHTPLRYPGGKTRLAGFLRKVIELDGSPARTYVEPYAGGGGAALSLLHDQVVDRVVINDLDPCMWAFWTSVVNNNTQFLKIFDETPVTLAEWHRQREVYRRRDHTDLSVLRLGFATFFLNRTNRSGIMNAGVIGGQKQVGTYKIDARFNREELRRKIKWIGTVRSKIQVENRDGVALLAETLENSMSFAYIDPPYFEKGSFLYMNSFEENDHALLATLLRDSREARWVLTYDDVPAIRKLYRGFYQGIFRLPYSAHTASNADERMVLSDRVAELNGILPNR